MDGLTKTTLKQAFDVHPITLGLDKLRSSRRLPDNATTSRKFLQILASIATVGLVEPLIVARDPENEQFYRVLDGRLRIEALHRLGISEAICLIANDDEAYTYNKHINRLTPAQDARMIARAIERGVPKERIASSLGIDVNTVRRRATMLDGICREAAALIADKNCPATTYATLKLMKPLRQIEAAELMRGQTNFSSVFAKAILAATPESQLERQKHSSGKTHSELTSQLARLEREFATLQATIAQTDEQYGVDHLHLTVSAAYIATLMHNPNIAVWMGAHHPEFSAELKAISDESGNLLPAVKSNRSRIKHHGDRRTNSRPTQASL
ncbi:plasmid partitioning protein RepB C-terminal domain-containing protein [Paraburkholderia diazotrophica]|uniref:Chromosome segregation protein Spo0J, contains ParB-like nuclease domain n=1 Tax=Paraburkholderia diazotrophica TaxID=667676 RepID=A0A1H7D4U1_9BURK|nr:plasmid partitioning protein RepB C-terminal domain-containing protein [Paraburkholderia diazotrophica]SEJ96818.1 Chromosome segregation protein Spo0J, contains ParB-like nuclease domain [Paraburkholderia diazotrophica]